MSGVDPNRSGVLVVGGGGASLPEATGANQIPVSTGAGTTYVATAAAGVRAAISAAGATAGLLSALPASASEGDSYYATDTQDVFFWRNGAWTYPNGLPVEALPATPILHLRADLGVTSSSSVVSAWASQGSISTSASQSTSGYRPTIVTGVLNGKPGILFDGTDDYMDVAYNASWTPSALTLFAVVWMLRSGNQVIIGVPNESSAHTSPFARWWLYSGTNTVDLRVGTDAPAGLSSVGADGVSHWWRPEIYCYSVNSGSRIFRVNGQQAFTTTGATPSNPNSAVLRLAANGAAPGGGSAERSKGYFHEFMLFDSVLTTAQKATIERQLSARWGIPLVWCPQ